MYKVVALGQIAYQGVNRSTAIDTFKDWVDNGYVAGLYLNGLMIASNDTDLLEDEDELVTSGIQVH